MSRYHINQATGKVSACRATKRCPFGDLEKDHYKSPQAAREAYEKDQDTFSPNPALIPLASALIVAKPKVSNNAVAAEADYDSYGRPESGCKCDPDDYCRCSIYEGLHISKVDMPRALEKLTGIPEEKLPKTLLALGEENHLDSEDGYDIAVYPGYYGERYSIEFANPSKLQRDLDKWHARNCLDANDKVGLYLASKGHDPRKVNSVKLMKKHLKNAVPREELEKVSTMRVERVLYSDVPAVGGADAIPSLPSAVLADHGVRGVLIKDGGAYKVVDGGGATSTPSRASSGLFIVLE